MNGLVLSAWGKPFPFLAFPCCAHGAYCVDFSGMDFWIQPNLDTLMNVLGMGGLSKF